MPYSDVLQRIDELRKAREQYLTEARWTNKRGRWYKDFPWSTSSTRRVEGDLGDVVNWQAKADGDIE